MHFEISNFDARVFAPGDIPTLGSDFLAKQPAKVRQWVLAHLPEEKRGAALDEVLKSVASHICVAFTNDYPRALGWLIPFSNGGARTAWCHFILPPMSQSLRMKIGWRFMTESLQRYDALMCLVPRHLREVRGILEALGFDHITTLPQACFIHEHNRHLDGCLYIYRKKDHDIQF